MRRVSARFAQPGVLAILPSAWGLEFAIMGPVEEPEPFERVGNWAVVDVGRGAPMVQRKDWCWDSYEGIGERAKAAFASDAAQIALRIDSPGGEVSGCFELARELRALAESTGKPLLAYVLGTCCSAAFAIACAADEVATPETGQVGSVGVMAVSVDQSALDRAMGLAITVFTSGARKTDGNPHQPLTEAATANIQARIDHMAEIFFDLVKDRRGIEAKALEGNVFVGSAAVAAGLADRVASWSELVKDAELGHILSHQPSEGTAMSKTDEAYGALKKAAEGDDEDAKRAKKALKAWDDSEKPKDDKDEEEKKKAAASAAAAKAEDDKKKDEEAKALAANALALAAKVQALEADAAKSKLEIAAKEEGIARAALFARRPDFSAEVRATLAHVSIAALTEAVEKWPRASADPKAAANALTPSPTGGEKRAAYVPNLTAEERAILARLEPGPKQSAVAVMQGTQMSMPTGITQEEAAARAAELRKEMV